MRHLSAIALDNLNEFQSTHSLRSATVVLHLTCDHDTVSIHALLAECDDLAIITILQDKRFNPRTPCGVRPRTCAGTMGTMGFQSTHSLRSATPRIPNNKTNKVVSIHALLAECDNASMIIFFWMSSFNPRTPCGVRPRFVLVPYAKSSFQSTHSLRSATSYKIKNLLTESFQSTHSLRSATVCVPCLFGIGTVSIHALLAECDGFNGRVYVFEDVSIHALLAECDIP